MVVATIKKSTGMMSPPGFSATFFVFQPAAACAGIVAAGFFPHLDGVNRWGKLLFVLTGELILVILLALFAFMKPLCSRV